MKDNKLKELRENQGYSQVELAEKVGLNRSYLSQIESGMKRIPRKYLQKICETLNVTEAQLLGYEEVKRIDNDVLGYAIDIVDSITDASDMTKNERVEMLGRVYSMVQDVLERKLTPEQLEEEVQKLQKEAENTEKINKGFIEFCKKLGKNKNNNTSNQ